jgi:Winged helix DNA-binding domain
MTAGISTSELRRLRLRSQGLVRTGPSAGGMRSPAAVVDRMFALQGQDLPGVLWSLGLRSGARRSDVVAAFDSGELVRSWPFRGTLHVLAARDLPWILPLTGRRTLASAAKRHRDLGLDDGTIDKARTVAVEALQGGRSMSRRQLFDAFTQHGISTDSQRGVHLLWLLCLTGTLVLGPFDGEEQRVVLLEEWVHEPRALGREQALVEVVVRYLTGRGPATEKDLASWTKLPLGDVRRGLDGARAQLVRLDCGDSTYLAHEATMDTISTSLPRPVLLLPGFDELLLGYADRSASLATARAPSIVPGGNGMFRPAVVARGRVVGLWSRRTTTKQTVVTATAFEAQFTAPVLAGLRREVAAYGRYLDVPTELVTPAPGGNLRR